MWPQLWSSAHVTCVHDPLALLFFAQEHSPPTIPQVS